MIILNAISSEKIYSKKSPIQNLEAFRKKSERNIEKIEKHIETLTFYIQK